MKKALRRISNRLGRRRFRIVFSTIFCLPIVIWCCYSSGWRGLLTSITGIFIGQLISAKLFKD